jgi:hypothetical protein
MEQRLAPSESCAHERLDVAQREQSEPPASQPASDLANSEQDSQLHVLEATDSQE